MYKYLFNPISINGLEIKNRIAYPALGLLYSYDGKLNDRYYAFFAERAKGGAGIVTVGPVGVEPLGGGLPALSLMEDEAIPDFEKVTSIIKKEGARAWIQLFHAGGYSYAHIMGTGHPVAPSAIYSTISKTTPKEMTLEDIDNVQQAFADGARRAKSAGFDGVEIIASAGYLITQFLSPVKNKRTDAYGGSFENRVRFARELIGRVREAVGDDFPLTIRMAGNDFVTGSNTDEETPEIAKVYEDCGIDAINVTGGWHESKVPQLPMQLPRAAYAYLALNIKKAVSIPVMASNRIVTPEIADALIRDGNADLVNLGRVLIADPAWPAKAMAGRAEQIRPCVACSQGCTDQVFSAQPVFCVANPQAGYEQERKVTKTDNPKRVMVIGAGLAGLEAAAQAAQRGHQVELYEKEGAIGGQLWVASAPPHKKELFEFVRYYTAQIERLKIPLFLNTTVDAALIERKKPDFVVVAEGAEPLLPPIEGIDDPSVLSAWDVLRNNPPLGKEVAIIGGGSVGLETALAVAAKGTITPDILHFLMAYDACEPERLKQLMFRGISRVTVFEMLPKVGKDVGRSTKWILLEDLKRFGVNIVLNAKVTQIKDGNVQYEKEGATQTKHFDTVVVAGGSKPVTRMSDLLATLDIPHKAVGDGTAPGKISDAIHGGFLAALSI